MQPGPNLTLGSLLFVFVFAVSAVALYGGATLVDRSEPAAAADDGTPTTPGGPVSVRIVAKDLKYDKRSIAASPGVQVTVTLDSQDPAIHNIAFYTSRNAAQTIFKGELFPGPAVKEERFTSPSTAGNYYFRCDAHPDTMNGTFSVK